MKKIILALMGMGLMVACGSKNEVPERDVLVDSIEVMEQSLMNASVNSDLQKADRMIALYDLFANNYPDDSLAPIYMMRSAEIEINTGNYEAGIATLDSIMNLYPGYEELPICQFMKGTAYEMNQQYDLAREAYTEFVERYPDHVLASDTRKILPYVGLTPEEQLEAIMDK
ncbi:MAG: tetratricopeptide repeat protein [Bacteroidales bacterium]|nr:tetratricopeptide repeat protein [Bacteroidales bacterium]